MFVSKKAYAGENKLDMKIFKATYQDKALNRHSIKFTAFRWAEAIAKAFENKKAEEKFVLLEFVEEVN